MDVSAQFLISLSVFANAWLTSAKLITFSGLAVLTYLEIFKLKSFFSIFSLVAILVGSRDHRTQFWKGAIQGSFHKSLIAIGPVVMGNSHKNHLLNKNKILMK
jgi:hypothetical protein